MLSLLINYNRDNHLRNIRTATNQAKLRFEDFTFLKDPAWVSKLSAPAATTDVIEILIPKKIASHLIDSYYQLPERPDLAFMSLWMAINAAYHEIAVRESFKDGKERITDDYGLDCALDKFISCCDMVIGVNGSFRPLDLYFEDILKNIPEKILSMVATSWLRSIAVEKHNCSRRYASRSHESLKKNFPELATAIESSYGEAYSELCSPSIDIGTRELEYGINNGKKANSIIRSLSDKLSELLGDGAANFQIRESGNVALIQLNMKNRLRIFLRNFLYASRNNLAHGKVSSRLNSNTANRESYFSNVFIYIAGYIFLSVLLVELKHASPVVVSQALKNVELLQKFSRSSERYRQARLLVIYTKLFADAVPVA